MPYGLFDYGGTIQTMGQSFTDLVTGQTLTREQVFAKEGIPLSMTAPNASEAARISDLMRNLPNKYAPSTTYNNMTDAFPEDGRTKIMADEPTSRTNPYTRAFPEDGIRPPVTMMIPEDGIVKVRADEAPPSGGCPKGYEPSGGGKPRPYDRPVTRPAPIGEGRPAPVTLAIPE
jgi:hypothetical protein